MMGSTAKRPALVAAILAATMVVGASAAQAAPTWLAPVTLSNTAQDVANQSVDVAMDPAGNAVAVWARSNGTNIVIQGAYRPAGGSFGPPQNLSVAGEDASDPRVAMDGNGNAIAVWARSNGTFDVIELAARPAGAGSMFGPVDPVSSSGANADTPEVAMNSGGTALIAWRRGGVAEAILRQPNGSLGAPQPLSGPGVFTLLFERDFSRVEPAINDAGDAMVAWARDDGVKNVIEASYKPRGSNIWGAAQQASPGAALGGSTGPSLVLAPNGSATVAWERAITGTECDNPPTEPACGFYAELADRDAGAAAAFQGSQTVLAASGARIPRIVRQSDGTIVMIWIRSVGSAYVVQAVTRPPNTAFSAIQEISPSGANAYYPDIVIDPQGNAVAAWTRDVGGRYVVQASRKPTNQLFEPVKILSNQTTTGTSVSPFFRPKLGIDNEGNVMAGWARFTGSGGTPVDRWIAEAAAFDAAPPSFTGVNVPLTATTGQAVGMGAAAFDRMTGTALSWSFGDGSGASGGAVSQAYGAPGVYTVTVTATDAVGNAASTTRTIQVENPAPPPPPPETPRIRGVRLSFDYLAFDRYTKFTRLEAKGVPRGSTVRASCKFKKKKCPKKARKAFTKRRARGTVSLNKRYKGVKLKVGTTITVKVTKPGTIGAAKILTIRKAKVPKVVDRCMAVGSTKLRRRC